MAGLESLLPQPPRAKAKTSTAAISKNIVTRFIIFSFPVHMPACLVDLFDYNVRNQYWQLPVTGGPRYGIPSSA
jgi:hypothetical protein